MGKNLKMNANLKQSKEAEEDDRYSLNVKHTLLQNTLHNSSNPP